MSVNAVGWIAAAAVAGISTAHARDFGYFYPRGYYYVPRPAGDIPAFDRRSRFDDSPPYVDRLKSKTAEQLRKAPKPPPAKGPLLIAISLAHQRLTLYDDGVPIAQSPISSGTAQRPTPTGVFAVIQKQRWHRSNLYSDAPMPFMQRITWSGVAIHAGVLPGYPASHGCVRLPSEFAIRLWNTTQTGARVIITQGDVAPVEIVNPKLFEPRPKPLPPVANTQPPAPAAEVDPVPAPAPRGAAAAERFQLPAPVAKADPPAPATALEPAAVAKIEPAPVAAQAETRAPVANAEPAAAAPTESATASATPADPVPAAEAAPPAAMPAAEPSLDQPAVVTVLRGSQAAELVAVQSDPSPADAPVADTSAADPPAADPPAADQPAAVASAADPKPAADTSAVAAMPPAAAAPTPPASNAPAADVRPADPSVAAADQLPPIRGTQVDRAVEPNAGPKLAAASVAAAQPGGTPIAVAVASPDPAAAQPAPLRSGPVSVFISRKERRVFVRKGFQPVFDMPVAIQDPDRPIGLHVFTALKPREGSKDLRWTVISVPHEREVQAVQIDTRRGRRDQRAAPPPPVAASPVAATEALNRIELPPEAVERISELTTAGASLIIADEGLGPETGLETDFVVLTSPEQPVKRARPSYSGYGFGARWRPFRRFF